MIPRRLRTRLTVVYALTFTAVLGAFFAIAYRLVANELDRSATEDLTDLAEGLRGYIHFTADRPALVYDESDTEISSFIRTASRYFQLYDLSTGEVVLESRDMESLGLGLTPGEVLGTTDIPGIADFETDNDRFRFYYNRIHSDSGSLFLMQVGARIGHVDAALAHFKRFAYLLLPFGGIATAALGWMLVGRTLSPIRKITAAAHDIEVSELSRRLPQSGNGDEVDQLAATFNATFERLDHAVGEMRQFTSGMAHELRTPLAAIRGEAEHALLHAKSVDECKATLASQIETVDHLNSMIGKLLTLARAEAGELRLAVESVDLDALLREVTETFSPVGEEKSVDVSCDCAPGLHVQGDRHWIEHALFNLVDNAVKYTPSGGKVTLRGRQENDTVILAVSDTGVGIPGRDIPRLFDRFFRADESRSKQTEGFGLGLALVQWIVRQHHGTITVESTAGQGSTFCINLPIAAPPG